MPSRRFLFLQGPHGPFFGQLARRLHDLALSVTRVGFNQGDRAFWPRGLDYIAFAEPAATWPETLDALISEHGFSDLVLYGDTRAIHAEAIAVAQKRGLRVHVFEEGYLRPYWVTYERDGSNGHSALMQIGQAEVDAVIGTGEVEPPAAPATWGAMREHIFYGALYHFFVLALNQRYPHFQPHRTLSVGAELRLYLRLLALMAPRRVDRMLTTRRIQKSGVPYHLVLLQLAHDASFCAHGPFASMSEFLRTVLQGFADGAPPGHHLVFKAHPLEDGRVPLKPEIEALARQFGLSGRVHFVHGGKLAHLLDDAVTAVTVNSTAAHQALWRGLPVKAFGEAIYRKPEFVSEQPLAAFFAAPEPPDLAAYRRFRQYLLQTSQVPGSFYSSAGRRRLLRRIPDLLLAESEPYAGTRRGKMATKPPLSLVQR